MLNNFFFGYLPLKWKRLARVLSIILLPVTGIISWSISDFRYEFYTNELVYIGVGFHIILVLIISYTIKPFVVKEK